MSNSDISWRPIRRLLIANRGEITCRIARTARARGITVVGVYSDADRHAPHVAACDVAVSLGGSTPVESYLRLDAVVNAAVRTGCDAVHPGYGFLAERADAARAVIEAGLVWVGPTPEQIEQLGDKVAAKRLAIDAGVPTTSIVEIDDPRDHAAVLGACAGLSFPLLVKAAAGGGGRGMRIVVGPDDLGTACESAAREAEAAFGDPRLFIEPFLAGGRHIEVQIMGDRHGNVIHLGDRDCSIQRRNQKVVEEAPAPHLDDATRLALRAGAVALAQHVGYEGAGTVEFLVGVDGTITFLEVNTRLQVEHPVTEAVTGCDLVDLQLTVASGDPLPLSQNDVVIDGHAVEVRIVAEDPAAGWVPSTGTLSAFEVPEGVRVDTGVEPGTQVSADYDSLLAKVIAHAGSREQAIDRLGAALRATRITGVRTNLAMLSAVCAEDDFIDGGIGTDYLPAHPDVVAATGFGRGLDVHLVAATLSAIETNRAADHVWGFVPAGWRNMRTRGVRRRWIAEDGSVHGVEYRVVSGGYEMLIGDWPEPGDDGTLGEDLRFAVTVVMSASGVEIDGVHHRCHREVDGDTVTVTTAAGTASWRCAPTFSDHDAAATGAGPIAPLPGTVIAVAVDAGDRVAADDLLMVIEAMKMEHRVTAPTDAVVAAVRFAVGDRVDMGDLLVELDDSAGDGEGDQ